MSDARWLEWLRVTRAAVVAPESELLASLLEAAQTRAQLAEDLERHAPEPPSEPLAAELAQAERELQDVCARAGTRLSTALAELRQVRTAARGYRPTPNARPSLVSRTA